MLDFLFDMMIFFNKSFIKLSLQGLIYESINALEVEPSILFNLHFGKNTISSYFFSFS